MTCASTVGVSSGSDTIPTVASTGRVAATALLGPPDPKQGLGILGTWLHLLLVDTLTVKVGPAGACSGASGGVCSLCGLLGALSNIALAALIPRLPRFNAVSPFAFARGSCTTEWPEAARRLEGVSWSWAWVSASVSCSCACLPSTLAA